MLIYICLWKVRYVLQESDIAVPHAADSDIQSLDSATEIQINYSIEDWVVIQQHQAERASL